MSCTNSDATLSRIGWYLHHRLKGEIDQVSARTGIAPATLRRYMEHCPRALAEGRTGPQRLPVLFRILTALEVNPAKLAVAVQYALDAPTFWRFMNARLYVEHAVSLQVGVSNPREIKRELIGLDDDLAVGSAESHGHRLMRASVDRLQAKLATYFSEAMRGRMSEIRQATGLAPTTLRRYGDPEGSPHGGAGPQSVRAYHDILQALGVDPAKLMVAAYYSADDYSFRMLMNASLCLKETLQVRTNCDNGRRIEESVHYLEAGRPEA